LACLSAGERCMVLLLATGARGIRAADGEGEVYGDCSREGWNRSGCYLLRLI